VAYKEITVQDCDELYARFKKYTETAEQHEFLLLALLNHKLDRSMKEIHDAGMVFNQKDTRAMFRVVLKAIGEDFSEYREVAE
jgi:uncharacterized protein YaaW (UPF0174 family)